MRPTTLEGQQQSPDNSVEQNLDINFAEVQRVKTIVQETLQRAPRGTYDYATSYMPITPETNAVLVELVNNQLQLRHHKDGFNEYEVYHHPDGRRAFRFRNIPVNDHTRQAFQVATEELAKLGIETSVSFATGLYQEIPQYVPDTPGVLGLLESAVNKLNRPNLNMADHLRIQTESQERYQALHNQVFKYEKTGGEDFMANVQHGTDDQLQELAILNQQSIAERQELSFRKDLLNTIKRFIVLFLNRNTPGNVATFNDEQLETLINSLSPEQYQFILDRVVDSYNYYETRMRYVWGQITQRVNVASSDARNVYTQAMVALIEAIFAQALMGTGITPAQEEAVIQGAIQYYQVISPTNAKFKKLPGESLMEAGMRLAKERFAVPSSQSAPPAIGVPESELPQSEVSQSPAVQESSANNSWLGGVVGGVVNKFKGVFGGAVAPEDEHQVPTANTPIPAQAPGAQLAPELTASAPVSNEQSPQEPAAQVAAHVAEVHSLSMKVSAFDPTQFQEPAATPASSVTPPIGEPGDKPDTPAVKAQYPVVSEPKPIATPLVEDPTILEEPALNTPLVKEVFADFKQVVPPAAKITGNDEVESTSPSSLETALNNHIIANFPPALTETITFIVISHIEENYSQTYTAAVNNMSSQNPWLLRFIQKAVDEALATNETSLKELQVNVAADIRTNTILPTAITHVARFLPHLGISRRSPEFTQITASIEHAVDNSNDALILGLAEEEQLAFAYRIAQRAAHRYQKQRLNHYHQESLQAQMGEQITNAISQFDVELAHYNITSEQVNSLAQARFARLTEKFLSELDQEQLLAYQRKIATNAIKELVTKAADKESKARAAQKAAASRNPALGNRPRIQSALKVTPGQQELNQKRRSRIQSALRQKPTLGERISAGWEWVKNFASNIAER